MTAFHGGASRIFSFHQASRRLQRVWALLPDLPRRALASYRRHLAKRLSQPSGRLRATAIHDFMIDELRMAAGADLFFARGRWLLRGDDIIVQFKKMDSAGRTSNYPTQAAQEFKTQLDLPGIPSAMRVTLGYRLDKTNTEVVDVALIASDGEDILWRESIDESNQLPLVIPARVNTSRTKVRKLSAKTEAAEARGVTKTKKKKNEEN